MHEEFVKENKILELTDKQKETELIKNIIMVKAELKTANKNFEFAEDELTDYYTYQIKANQAKLDYLIRIAKTRGIVVDMIKQIEIKLYGEEIEVG